MRRTGNAKGKTLDNTRDVNAARRVQTALKLRAQRLTYEEIAHQCGYESRGACHNAIMRELQRCISEDVKQVRLEELASLDAAEAEVWPLFLDRKNSYRLYALDRILAIKERRAKYLGLDQTPDAALMAGVVVIQEVPQGYLAPVEAAKE